MQGQIDFSEYESVKKEYEKFKSMGLKLDMSRGKPSKAQLDLSNGLLDVLNSASNCVGAFD